MALAAMTTGQLVMIGTTSTAPLYLHDQGHQATVIGLSVSIHLGGMYVASPLSGWLCDRFGRLPMIGLGGAVLLVALAIAGLAPGSASGLVMFGLFLNGIGWNLAFVSGSALLTDALSPEDGDPVMAIHALTEGGVDLAIESVGSAAVVRQAFDAIAPGGRAVAVGLTRYAEEVSVPLVSLLLDKSLRGSIHGSADPGRDFPKLFALAARGALRLEEMAGPDYPLEKVNDAFEALASGRAVRPRVVLEPALARATEEKA